MTFKSILEGQGHHLAIVGFAVIHPETAKEDNLAELDRITIGEVKKMIDRGEPVLLIDTRNPHDWGESDVRLPGALRIHYSELKPHLEELPRDRTIVTYCT